MAKKQKKKKKKKICFPIDAKRFPIDGDMQIAEFLYARAGHFSFTQTKARPWLSFGPVPRRTPPPLLLALSTKTSGTCRTRRFKYRRRTVELFLDRENFGEYACRARGGTLFANANFILNDRANYYFSRMFQPT